MDLHNKTKNSASWLNIEREALVQKGESKLEYKFNW